MKSQIKIIVLLLFGCLFLFSNAIFSQTAEELKAEALKKDDQEDYAGAIKLLEQALLKDSTDKEIYYYLGVFNHYRIYDSRPFDYDRQYCDKILYYLDKALELDKNYGDAREFYAVQCGADASDYLQNNDTVSALNCYLKAYKKDCFPPWIIEYGKNVLNCCPKNSILICNGDAEFNTLNYLQLVEKVRTDVTVIVAGLLDRPAYVLLLKNGLGRFVKQTKINLSYDAILNMRDYKWTENSIEIELSSDLKQEYNLTDNLNIDVKPDLKFISEKPDADRTYLSAKQAVLLSIIEANINERDIFCTNYFYYLNGDLSDYLQSFGIVFKFMPFKTKGTQYESNYEFMERFLKKENFVDYPTVATTDQPRISTLLYKYTAYCWYPLIKHYIDLKNEEKEIELLKFLKHNLIVDNFGLSFEEWLKMKEIDLNKNLLKKIK